MQFFTYNEDHLQHLKKRDKRLGRAIDVIGYIQREVTPDLFTALIEQIISQQISRQAAITVSLRLQTLCGKIAPDALAGISVESIQ